MGLEAESNNAKKELNSLHCLIPSRFIELFYFLLLANTNAPPVKKTADRIRYKVPLKYLYLVIRLLPLLLVLLVQQALEMDL